MDEIKEIMGKIEPIYSNLHELFAKEEAFYECDIKGYLKMPKQFEADRVILPTGRDTVDTAVDHTDIANARVFVNKKGTSAQSEESAEMMRKIALGIIHRTNVESSIAPGRQSAKHFWLHGLGVLKILWDADRWMDKPAQKEGENENDYAERLDAWRAFSHYALPIHIQAVNPAAIFPDPATGGGLYIIEKHKKLMFDARTQFPLWSNPLGKDVGDYVEYATYYDKTFRCDLLDGEPILKVRGGVAPHKYGFIPYTLIESGLGNLSIEAQPEMRYVGLLRYMLDLLVSESLNYTLTDILMKRETMKGGYITGSDSGTVGEIKQEYGTYFDLGQKDVEFHDWGTKLAPQEVYAHLATTSNYISAHGTPRSLMGMGESGVRSGADRRIVIAEAASKFNYSKDAFANGWANVLSKCMLLIKNVIPGNFNVWAKTPTDEIDVEVNKSALKEPFTFYVEFAPISEEDEYRRQDSLVKLWNGGNGLVTKDWARKQMSNVDAKAMARAEMKENLRNSPTFLQIKDQVLAAKYQEALQSLGLVTPPPIAPTSLPSESQSSGIGGQEGGRSLVPPIPNRSPLGSSGNLENQIKARQQMLSSGIQTQGRNGGGNRG